MRALGESALLVVLQNMTGANTMTTLHRLFGDAGIPDSVVNAGPTTFSAIVNSSDNFDFSSAFNKPHGGGFQAYLDFDGDGAINSLDNLQFRSRFKDAEVACLIGLGVVAMAVGAHSWNCMVSSLPWGICNNRSVPPTHV
jgi:hypothetical protein